MNKKRRKTIANHRYADTDFIIVVTDPTEDRTLKGNACNGKVDVHCRYQSMIGVFVIKLVMTKEFMAASAIPWKDYVANVCLRTYEKEKGNRIKALTGAN